MTYSVEAVERWLWDNDLIPDKVYRASEGDIRVVLEVNGEPTRFSVVSFKECLMLVPMP